MQSNFVQLFPMRWHSWCGQKYDGCERGSTHATSRDLDPLCRDPPRTRVELRYGPLCAHLGLTSGHSYSKFWGWMEVHAQHLQQHCTVWLFGAQEHMSTKKPLDVRNKEMEVGACRDNFG